MIQLFIRTAVLTGVIGGFTLESQGNEMGAVDSFADNAAKLNQQSSQDQEKADKSSNRMNFLKRGFSGSCTKDCAEIDSKQICGKEADAKKVKFCKEKCESKYKILKDSPDKKLKKGETFTMGKKCKSDLEGDIGEMYPESKNYNKR